MYKSISNSLLTLLGVFLFCSSVFAQDEKENFVGFKGGISIPKLSGGSDNELSRDYKSRLAPNFGGFVEFGVARKTSLQFEVNYAGHGGKRVGIQPVPRPITGLPTLPAGNYYYADFRNIAKLNYLEIPALVKYKFGSKGKPRFYLDGGAFYGYLLNAKSVTSGSSTLYFDRDGRIPVLIPPANTPFPAIPLDASTDIKDEINRNNFGIAGGGGIEIPHKKNYFLIDARVSYGLRAIQKDTVTNGNNKTGNLVISVGYAFGFK
jgi:hypothetical protein